MSARCIPRAIRTALLIALVTLVVGIPASATDAAASAVGAPCVAFPETGKQICGAFLAHWQANGGLAQQGLPLTDAFVEVNPTDGKPYLTQYFERARFEAHPEHAPPYDVLLGLLGQEQLQAKYGGTTPPGLADNPLGAACVAFPETGKQICGAFLAHWQANGGLAQQGLPLTDLFLETNPTDGRQYPTQYTERARFEYHAAHQGTPHAVLLGLLGREQLLAKYHDGIPPGAGPGGGIVVRPGESIQAAVDSAPAGATVLVRAGVYAESVSVPRPLTLAGEAGAILDGGCGLTHGVAIADIPDVTVQGLTIRHYRGSGVQVSGPDADRITVRGNDIHDFACAGGRNSTYAGVSFYYSGSHQRVVGNTIRFRAAATDRAGRVGGQNGVWFKSASGPGEASGGHHTVTDNVIVGGWDGIGGEGEDDPHGVWDGNATVLRNHVSDCHDDGISAEGFTGGSHFSDNTVVDCGLGFANASRRNSGEVRFERNVITSNAVGFYGNQACFKLGDGGTQTAYIVGNRCTLTVGDGLAQTNAGISTLVVTDNLWMTGRYVYEITNLPGGGSTFDRNCMATTDPTRFVKYGNARYLTLAEFQRAAGQEAHGRLGPCE